MSTTATLLAPTMTQTGSSTNMQLAAPAASTPASIQAKLSNALRPTLVETPGEEEVAVEAEEEALQEN